MTTARADYLCVSEEATLNLRDDTNRVVASEFLLCVFLCGCLGSKRKRVSVDRNLPIDPSISPLYSTLHCVPQHLIRMTRALQTF